ncbi:outer membrane protein [Thermonema lapsum]|uniref:Outer membrane protein n=1 Tax=Thermonema lapsum TaxID=28195 RepID=A0A846MR01_9BACT|nr:OmpH family outer membrane protein [Thermonema lapsum]NIK74088.1 outer membrane protein [Thermonema lapsum]
MKKLLLPLALSLFFFGSCQKQSEKADEQAQSVQAEVSAQKTEALPDIVYVNSDSLLAKYAFYKDAQKELEKKRKSFEQDLNSRVSSLERDIADFQQKANSMTLQQAKATEQSLIERQQNLAQYKQTLENQYLEEEFKMAEKLNKNLEDFMQRYAKEKGYKLILGYKPGVTVWYGDPSLDVTDEVVKLLNEEYKNQEKQADKSDKQKKSDKKTE